MYIERVLDKPTNFCISLEGDGWMILSCVFIIFVHQMAKKTKKMMKNSQKEMNRQARRGESDRHVFDLKPKHLLSGKRKSGTTDHR